MKLCSGESDDHRAEKGRKYQESSDPYISQKQDITCLTFKIKSGPEHLKKIYKWNHVEKLLLLLLVRRIRRVRLIK